MWLTVQGMVTLTLSAWVPGFTPDPDADNAKWYQSALLFGSLYIVALGTGGIKPNVSAFGADQFDESDPQVDTKPAQSLFIDVWSMHAKSAITRVSSGIVPEDLCVCGQAWLLHMPAATAPGPSNSLV